MNDRLERLKKMMHSGNFTCVIETANEVFTSIQRGVKPLLEFLDSGKDLDTVARFLRPLIIARADKLLAAREVIDPKSYLQEIVQEAKGLLEYEIVSESGPDHNKIFVCEVKIDHNVMGRGEGSSKKKAEIAAAHDALKNYIR